MEAAISSKSSKRGRPAVEINWPNSPFTVETVKSLLGDKLSKVAIQLRVKKAVDEKVLIAQGTEKTTGRPRVIYVRVATDSTPVA
jgi:hypothetical protein